jgi:hypothetical protein
MNATMCHRCFIGENAVFLWMTAVDWFKTCTSANTAHLCVLEVICFQKTSIFLDIIIVIMLIKQKCVWLKFLGLYLYWVQVPDKFIQLSNVYEACWTDS